MKALRIEPESVGNVTAYIKHKLLHDYCALLQSLFVMLVVSRKEGLRDRQTTRPFWCLLSLKFPEKALLTMV